MTIYTGVADANGDFIVPFSASYTAGQKVTVTALKDGAQKTIELFAPSDVISGGAIQFSGNLTNFPVNIGIVTLSGLSGNIGSQAFFGGGDGFFGAKATGLIIEDGVVKIQSTQAFSGWVLAKSLRLPNTLTDIGDNAFFGWRSLIEINIPNSVVTIGSYVFGGTTANSALNIIVGSGCKTIGQEAFWNQQMLISADFGSSITTLGQWACGNWISCNQIIMRAIAPPSIQVNTFGSLKSTCIFKVPASSVDAYKSAPNWSAFASKIQAI